MDASILIVGCDTFQATLTGAIHDLATFAIESVEHPDEAAPLIQAQQPDVLVMQVEQGGCFDLCRQIKAEPRIAWIYCILVSDRAVSDAPSALIEQHVAALEAGADAFLEQSPADPDGQACTLVRMQQNRLLQAHIQAGLRRVRTQRELMRRNDVLSTIALADPLTELNNRRAFDWELPRQIQNARARALPISLLMLDVDYFKAINDNHGHLVGDRVLKLIAARLRHNLRYYDTPFRYGGEEFVIILGDTDCQEAAAIAQRLCRLVSDQPFAISDQLNLTITMSAGAASLQPDDDAKGISLLERADQHLLLAKSKGRNCVVSCH